MPSSIAAAEHSHAAPALVVEGDPQAHELAEPQRQGRRVAVRPLESEERGCCCRSSRPHRERAELDPSIVGNLVMPFLLQCGSGQS
jgi:hypothetical protein